MKIVKLFLVVLVIASLTCVGKASAAVKSTGEDLTQTLRVDYPEETIPSDPPLLVEGGGGQPPAGGQPSAPCPCCGVVWHADNQEGGETYGESPIGGLAEKCWITGQVWTDQPQPERWTFAIRPGTVVWLRGHRGGTAWNFSGDEAAVWEDIKKQARELEERDGPMMTGILMLPDQASLLRLIIRVQTASSPLSEEGG